ncbi:MAG: selenium cofactor biosynthesis protein YqeC, partial [Clostridia bacterium]|nr:selenium cofactor biosynthesis protein YqeC [Clostridia bacterium]
PDSSLSAALAAPRGVTALVGGGGKTTLMFRLARELAAAHKVVVATTTHVMRPQDIPVLVDPTLEEIRAALSTENAIFVGRVASHDKMTASGIEAGDLAAVADYVLVEADGARGRPLKAPAF